MFVNYLLAVALLVLVCAIPAHLFQKVVRGDLEIEIMRRQKALEKPVFDDVDFEKYSSIRELIRLNEELKSLQRMKKAKEGSLAWHEGVVPVSGKVLQKQNFEYIELEEPQKTLIPLNWDLFIVGQEKENVNKKRRDRRIQEVNELKEKVDGYFEKCFGRNVIEAFNTKISWGEAEFFIKLALKYGFIEEHALQVIKRELDSIFLTSSLKVTGHENIICITFETSEIESPTDHYMFSKFASEGIPKTPLTIMAGVDKDGRVRQYDLSMTGGVLMYGSVSTSGVKDFISQTISSIMLHSKPEEVKFMLYSPNEREYYYLKRSPYLYTGIMNKEEEILNALAELKSEMERRLKLFSGRRVDNISDFNNGVSKEEKLPYLLVMLTESDSLLLGDRRKEVIELLMTLTTKGRTTGIILMQAVLTQMASSARTDLIPYQLKTRFSCVIASHLRSDLDSIVAIGKEGAEKLLESEFLIKWIDSPEATKIKMPDISYWKLQKIIDSTTKEFS